MLNELKMLADSLQSAGIDQYEWHKDLKKLPNSDCFIVTLSEKGEIVEVRFVERAKASDLRKWEKSNGESFPAFNFKPFCNPSSDEENKKAWSDNFLKEYYNVAKQDGGSIEFLKQKINFDEEKLRKCLGRTAETVFEMVLRKDDDEKSPLKLLQKAVSCFAFDNGASLFNERLLLYVDEHILGDKELEKILCGEKKITLFLDVYGAEPYVIAGTECMKVINQRLNEYECFVVADKTFEVKENEKCSDAFGILIQSEQEFKDKLPGVKLPKIGDTILRSMNSESPCQKRYGRVGPESFPIGSNIRKSVKSALEWIATSDQEGRTWAALTNDELVFAYPKIIPKGKNVSIVSIFAPTPIGNEARFLNYAEDALSGIRSLSTKSVRTEVEIFAIKKADKARRKVAFYRNYTLKMLDDAVAKWLVGAKNIPKIHVKGCFAVKNDKTKKEWVKKDTFDAPFPAESMRIIYCTWSKDSDRCYDEPPYCKKFLLKKEKNIPICNGIELFLSFGIETGLTSRSLSMLLQANTNLFVAIGNVMHMGRCITKSEICQYFENAVPLLGILLYKLNRMKELYMKDTPYLIGRFLNVVDRLHEIWWKNVKGTGDKPHKLLGSSFFASFQLNPVKAFADIGLRLIPYLDWAKTNKTEEAGLSRWLVNELCKTATAIKERGNLGLLSDTDKAEMLLGYLSYLDKSSDKSEETNEVNNDE